MIQSNEQINEGLVGFTDVIEAEVVATAQRWSYSLKLILADDSGNTVALRCEEVSNLRIRDFGGGLTQFLALRGRDARTNQIDKVNLHFSDLERGAIALDCRSASLEELS